MALKENYKNWIPDASGRKYTITQDEQGYYRIQDETTYTQTGENFGANDINAITHEVNGLSSQIGKIDSVKTVTIPRSTGSNYTPVTPTGGETYYTIEIPVTGMTTSYVGTDNADYVRPNPFTVEDNDSLLELFNLIMHIESMEGKIKVYVRELPTSAFQINLYGA